MLWLICCWGGSPKAGKATNGACCKKNSTERSFHAPLWPGTHAANARVLIHAEQGFGDTLQFIRYAPLVKERCAFLSVECPAPLVRALYPVRGIDQVVAVGSDLPAFDYHVPLLSLPGIFGTVEESIPNSTPYISPARSLTAKWRSRLPASNSLLVGLCWAGNPGHKNDRNRSIPAEQFVPLLGIPGVQFYSLQKDEALDGAEALGSELTDFADSAAALACLDLVISVDTSVAHLAGAMGKPVWRLLPLYARLALDAGPERQPVVSVHAPLPSD